MAHSWCALNTKRTKKENSNRLAIWYLSCTIPGSKFEKEKKSVKKFFSKVEIFKENVILEHKP